MVRKFLSLALLLAVSASLIHCTKGGVKTPDDTLVVSLGAQPATLDPRFATDANGIRIGGLIFNSLVRVGAGFEPVPDAAEKWTQKGAIYTFHLRPDLKFHNGRAITPEDVEFSFQEYAAKGSPFASTMESIKKFGARKEGDRIVVTIELKAPSEKFLVADLPIVRILPKPETAAAGSGFDQQLIGTGGFKFVKKDLNEIHLESVSAKVKNLVFKVIRDDLTRFQKLQKGEIDIAQAELPADKVGEFEKRPEDFQVFRYPGLTMTYILVNFKDKTLSQKAVREALARSIERKEIIDHKLLGLADEATSILTPSNPYYNGGLKNPDAQVEAAAKAIEALGLKGTQITLKTSNSPQAVDNAKVIANQLNRSGLNVQLQSFEWATFYDDVKKGNFQLATMKWVGTVDPDIYRMAFHSKEVPPGRNRGSYTNPKLDKLMDEGVTAPRAKRKQIYDEVQRIVLEDFAIIPLWYDRQIAVANKSVAGYEPNPSSDFQPFLNVSKVKR
jgi:peptide/nickel transport system substrate-binding protein